ncbi:MAG TPA: hypothetical protein VJU78_19100 [Chitinophagaceae bacterium]|nr:hypothetical protein [Chitinophagaceae bacterium]
MESKYNSKDFEQYVKENADQYRMFPSDKVWKGVNNALHTRRKWYGFWLGFLLLMTGGAVTWVMTTYPSSKKENSTTLNTNTTSLTGKPVSIEKTPQDIKSLLPFAKHKEFTLNQTPSIPLVEGDNAILTQAPQNNIADKTVVFLPVSQYQSIQIERSRPEAANGTNGSLNLMTEIIASNSEKKPDSYPPAIATDDIMTKDNQADISPLTIESVTNAYHFKKPARKISWQLFITPTVSYRKLTVNKSLDNPSAFNYPFASLSDVNSAVTHKPDLGLQIGVSGRYPLTNALKLRGGLQFNINRYDIKAYAFNGEVATIDLNGGSGNSSNSISTWTNYRNYAGYKSDWLKNYYFSISAPIGAEIKLIGNNKTNFGIAGTLQPTYILKDRAYLISTDYKNYAEVPRLVRHVNLNTSFETFVNYTSGKTKWQVGPQVRYQILSSFHNKYPVKENLFDFGVKLGVTLNE